MLTEDKILLDHGEGGAASHRLLQNLFLNHFGSPTSLEDACVLEGNHKIAFSTDCFVVKPLEFPNATIGKLSICGTVNDLAVMGAVPKYLAVGFIIEEGFSIDRLTKIVKEMSIVAEEIGVSIAAGDTKVVGKNEADGLFITTTGIGFLSSKVFVSSMNVRAGDVVILSGTIAEHGAAILLARNNFGMEGSIESDCQPLHDLCQELVNEIPEIHCMRDPTRGGIATTLIEIATSSKVTVTIEEKHIPIRTPVATVCDLLGLDPLYLASEGRVLIFVPEKYANQTLSILQTHPKSNQARIIGTVSNGKPSVTLLTTSGGKRPLYMLEGTQLPRIC